MGANTAVAGLFAALAFSCGGAPAPAPATKPAPAPRADAATAPAGYLPMTVAGVGQNDDGSHVVLLVDEGRRRLLPLAIGGTEAASIALRHSRERFPRPLTHDLFDSALRALDARVVRVQIDELREGVFHGSVFIGHGDQVHRLDARPSDAIALALGRGAPIYAAETVVAAGGVRAEDLPQEAPATMPPPRELPPPAQPEQPAPPPQPES